MPLWAFLHGIATLLDAEVLVPEEAFTSLKFGLKICINGALSSSKYR